MYKSLGRRVGVILMVMVILGALAVPAASAGTLAAPSERTNGSQLNANSAGSGACWQYHVVRRGDNLTRIAYRYGTTVNALMRCNNIWNPDVIYIGQRLCICGGYWQPKPPPPPPPPRPKPQPWPQPKPCPVNCGPVCPPGCVPQPPPPQPHPWPQPQPQPHPWPPQPPCPQPWQRTCCLDPRAVITWPAQNAWVSGSVTVMGTAIHENFSYYKLEVGAGSNPNTWSWFDGGDRQVYNGALGVFSAGALPRGTYTIRLTVVDKSGNYPPPCQVTVVVC